MTGPTTDRNRERLRWRSRHRGTREMDVLLGSFAARHLDGFDAAQLAQYEAMLAEPDPDLFSWCLGLSAPPPEKMTGVLRLFVQHKVQEMSDGL